MKSLWNDDDAKNFKGDLGLRVYTTRLLGADDTLVLHGGGNTSVKIKEKNLFSEEEEILYVKGSGWDLASIEEAGFSPVSLQHLIRLAGLSELSDPEMVNEMKTHMTRASAPSPSVEAILHAILPFKYVDHTHADAVVSITNTENGKEKIQDIYGDSVVIIPYIMPGFDLARLCNELYRKESKSSTIGMILLNHGVFSFGDTAKESYERMIHLVSLAESYLQSKNAYYLSSSNNYEKKFIGLELASLRKKVSETAGSAMILYSDRSDRCLNFTNRPDLQKIATQGPATPDHVIRTKRIPLIGRDVDSFVKNYKTYFETNEPHAKERKTMLDPSPRVILDSELGLCTAGQNAKAAFIAADIYRHTMDIIERSELLGAYKALSEKDIFDMEYWDLEQAKLRSGIIPPIFSGEVVLITGSASGIGKACIDSFLKRGAAVIGLDLQASVETLYKRPEYIGIACDLTEEEQFKKALQKGVERFGGIDMLVLNAGIFPKSSRIETLSTADWKKTMSINLDANLSILRETYPFLKLSYRGGRVAIVGSKNVPAPGPGAAAYSVSKAALNQLMRVTALEWGQDNIRINSVHPNSVFDTGIWTDEVLKARAEQYGLSVEEYKKNNILKTEIKSKDVAELLAELCGPTFSKTTAAQIPIDGGNDRVL